MAARKLLTAARLREVLHYNPRTGKWRRLLRPYAGRWDNVGCIQKNKRGQRYVMIRVGGKKYLANRLAWLYMTSAWPPRFGYCPLKNRKARLVVDHINHNTLDNRWSNLRLFSYAQNALNRKSRNSNNTTGMNGLYRSRNGWIVVLSGQYFGYFRRKKDAMLILLWRRKRLLEIVDKPH